jgi:hypothetical protein
MFFFFFLNGKLIYLRHTQSRHKVGRERLENNTEQGLKPGESTNRNLPARQKDRKYSHKQPSKQHTQGSSKETEQQKNKT